MKTNLLLAILLTSSLTQGQTLVANLESQYITTTVYYEDTEYFYDDSQYYYEYRVDAKIKNKDISNITIDLCNPCELYFIFADGSYEIEFGDDFIKFDDIETRWGEFVFGFHSKYAPSINEAHIKASNRTYTNSIYSPACQIPEPNVMSLIFAFGVITLTKRRR
jgi:hypothetical protein